MHSDCVPVSTVYHDWTWRVVLICFQCIIYTYSHLKSVMGSLTHRLMLTFCLQITQLSFDEIVYPSFLNRVVTREGIDSVVKAMYLTFQITCVVIIKH